MDASPRDWAELPLHIVDMLVLKLDQFFDYIHFCGVCSQWRNAALEANVVHKASLDILKVSRKKLPMLIFKTDKNNDESRSVFNVTKKTTFDVKLPFSYKYRFVGSSRGWLICIKKPMAVTLVNPINNCTISLPVLKDPCQLRHKRDFEYYIKKGILLSDPDSSPNSFVVVVIYGCTNRVAFLKSGEQSWNFINSEGFFGSEIIHYKGKLYGVDTFGKLFEIDIPSKTVRSIVPGADDCVDTTYLVESQDGELLMVKRVWIDEGEDDDDDDDHGEDNHVQARAECNQDNGDNYTYHYGEGEQSCDSEGEDNSPLEILSDDAFPRSFEFKVLKMTHPIEEGSATWVEIKNIGPQALFVGDNQSVSVSTTNFPGCLPNSIYYITDHHNCIPPYVYRGLNEDSGIFDLENERFYWFHELNSSEKYVQPPIWFVPNPQEINIR